MYTRGHPTPFLLRIFLPPIKFSSSKLGHKLTEREREAVEDTTRERATETKREAARANMVKLFCEATLVWKQLLCGGKIQISDFCKKKLKLQSDDIPTTSIHWMMAGLR